MADSKLSELPALTNASGSDLLYLVHSTTSNRITASNLFVSMMQFKSPPANAKGVAGDMQGMIAFDSSNIYVCTANYSTGTANIWARVSISTLW